MRRINVILPVCLSVLLGCTTSNDSQDMLSITIKDLTAPTIAIQKKSYSITEGDSFDIDDCYSVSDNMTDTPTVVVEDNGFNNTKIGTYKIKITATDDDGNETTDSFTVEVKEKPKPTPTPTVEAKQEQKDNTNSSINSSSARSSNNKSNQSTTVQQTVPSSQDASSQSQEQSSTNDATDASSNNETTTYTDGPYEDANACRTAARSKGAFSYRCYDQNGQTYLEWEE